MPAYNPDTNIKRPPSSLAVGILNHAPGRPELAPTALTPKAGNGRADEAADALHDSCGVYTRPALVQRLLDRIGWTPAADLAGARLLEPGAGDGAFLVEAVARLVASLVGRGLRLDIASLSERILAYEVVPREANKARARIVAKMKELGVHHATARACARAWVKTEDFLLADLPHASFTHLVGNPPYIRWAKLPETFAETYAAKLPKALPRGDLYLPFLHRSFEHLAPEGRCAFVCSDRWRYAVYADGFRKRWCTSLHITTEDAGDPKDIFDRDVYVHPEILIASPRTASSPRGPKRRTHGKTLDELSCTIRVGPALGVTPAFVLDADEDDVEGDLLHRWLDARDVRAGSIEWSGRRVISPYDVNGDLVELVAYPLFASRLRRFDARLRDRHIVRNGAVWYRTIDKITPTNWSAPKLLIPEFAKSPRVAIDLSGAIPSHGVYAVFSHDTSIQEVYDRLRDGKLARALAPIAPRVKGGYTRCYRRFLAMMEI